MLSHAKLSEKLQEISVYVFVFQIGLLVGIEAVYLAVFTGNTAFQEAYGHPSLGTIGLATSMYPICAAVGALSTLYFVHLLGDITIIGVSTLSWLIAYLIGVLITGNIAALMSARIIKGCSIGLSTGISPLYIEKVVPTKRHAAQLLTSLQASVPSGILSMALVAKSATNVQFRIRWIYAAAPSLPVIITVFYLPHANENDCAKEALQLSPTTVSMSGWAHMISDIKAIKQSQSRIMRLVAASLAQAASPSTATNVIFYYSTILCQMLGFGVNDSEFMAIGLYATNFVGTGISLFFINKSHRLATIRYTVLSLGIIHSLLYVVRLTQDYYPRYVVLGIVAMALIFIFVLFFSTLFAGISLVYTSEVVPIKTRTASIGLATFVGWLFNFIITITSASLMPILGSYMFSLYAIICFSMYCAFSIMPPQNCLASSMQMA